MYHNDPPQANSPYQPKSHVDYIQDKYDLVEASHGSTAWKVSKNGVISGPYFPVFGLNTGKYGPEITPYLDTFHAVSTHLVRYLKSSILKSIVYV